MLIFSSFLLPYCLQMYGYQGEIPCWSFLGVNKKKENVFNGDFNDVYSCHPKDDLSNWVYNSLHYITHIHGCH